MSGPTVTLTFEGNENDLVNAMDHVGKSSQQMADHIGSSAKDIKSHTKAFDTLAEGTDGAEKHFMGFHDVVDGATAGLSAWNDESLSGTDKMIAMGQSAADLAGGMTNFLLPAMSNITTFMRGGLASAMSFIAAHPLIIALAALVAIFVLLWTHSETFRRIVIDSFKAVGEFIMGTFKGAIDGITNAWNAVIHFFESIPDKIGRALGGIGNIFRDAFKGAVNIAVDVINWFIDRANDLIHGINIINPFTDIPPIPKLAKMHSGGVVSGPPGSDQPRMLQAGETVISAGSSGSSGGGLTLYVPPTTGSDVANMIMNLFRSYQIQLIDSAGRAVQVVG